MDVALTGRERNFGEDDIIVSKTDLKGRLIYANRVFLDIADLTLKETIGQPHSLIRHPHMPRCIFKLLWERIQAGKELFAYVMNRSMNGDHYWVIAHVTPSYGTDGQISGYHSNRRVAKKATLETVIAPLYAELRAIEDNHANRKDGMNTAYAALNDKLNERNVDYDRFIFSI
jgi:PAS domain S-box-containing protein